MKKSKLKKAVAKRQSEQQSEIKDAVNVLLSAISDKKDKNKIKKNEKLLKLLSKYGISIDEE